MQSGGPRQRDVAHRLTSAPRRRPASAAALVAALAAWGGLAQGGAARAAVAAPSIFISPVLIGASQLPATFTTNYFEDSDGAFDNVFLDGQQIPFTVNDSEDILFTAAPPCGQHTLTVQEVRGEITGDTTGTFFVSCITATPGAIATTQQPATITVAGGAFAPLVPVALRIDGNQAGQVTPARGAMTISTPITANGLACGLHTVSATQLYTPPEEGAATETVIATAPLTVGQCARLTVNPPVMPDGTLTHVTGTGFNPGEQVAITWQVPGGAVVDACASNAIGGQSVAADASGNIDVYCLALAHVALGAEQIAADQAATAQVPAEQATAPVVVEGGSMQPSSGDELIFRR
ncbi:MAG TPA: hypothetical protein VFU73_15475 [Actinocrinis sp.]|nr:hypothetical protein [Actinocrinis sp.]